LELVGLFVVHFTYEVNIYGGNLMEKLTQAEASQEAKQSDRITVAKRITRKLCIVNNLHWHDLLQYEQGVCKPEDSWSYRNWVIFMLNLGLTEDQIFNTAQQRIHALSLQG